MYAHKLILINNSHSSTGIVRITTSQDPIYEETTPKEFPRIGSEPSTLLVEITTPTCEMMTLPSKENGNIYDVVNIDMPIG